MFAAWQGKGGVEGGMKKGRQAVDLCLGAASHLRGKRQLRSTKEPVKPKSGSMDLGDPVSILGFFWWVDNFRIFQI